MLRNGSEGLVARCHSFLFTLIILVCMHTHVRSIHSSVTFAALHSIFLHCFPIMRGLPQGAEPRIELGAALQQLDVIPSGLRRTLSELRRTVFWASPLPHPVELRRTLMIYAAPYWSTPHPTDLRRTLLSNAAPYWLILAKYGTRWLCPLIVFSESGETNLIF
jgi:hypothetical protein